MMIPRLCSPKSAVAYDTGRTHAIMVTCAVANAGLSATVSSSRSSKRSACKYIPATHSALVGVASRPLPERSVPSPSKGQ